MILSIEVDGFRSLNRFRLDIRPGLNLLVGPNGSGKTNVISFLEFLTELAVNDLSTIVSNLGGSGAVFRKLGANRYQSQIKAKVFGKIKADARFRHRQRAEDEQEDDRILYYKYAFTLELSDDRESVFFAKQSIRFSVAQDPDVDPRAITEWSAEVQVSGNADGSVNCDHLNLIEGIKFSPIYVSSGKTPELTPIQQVEKSVSSDAPLIVLAYALLPSELGGPLYSDFGRGMIFNPHPSRIRLPEDSAKTPGIRPDGSGLYASLFALKRGKPRSDPGYFRFIYRATDVPFSRGIKLDRLIEFFKLAYPAMANLAVTNDQFENTIRVRITLAGPAKSQIPLAALSDGTLKWMAFVTAVFTNSNIMAIEEPENFVHPFVQREAVKLVRNQLQDNSFMFMSTHQSRRF